MDSPAEFDKDKPRKQHGVKDPVRDILTGDWEVEDTNNDSPYDMVGPYSTKDEANSVKWGLRRFYRDNPEFKGKT